MRAVKWGSLVLFAGLWFLSASKAQAVSGGDGSVSLVDGSYNYRYDFELPPGRKGMSPSLALLYSSDAGRSYLGYGWRWNIPYIARSTSYGAPSYEPNPINVDTKIGRPDYFEYHDEQGSTHLLIPVEEYGDRVWFRCLREGLFAWFGYEKSRRIWTVLLKNGQRQELGNPAAPFQAALMGGGASKTGVLEWYLNKQEDTTGNTVEYAYAPSGDGLLLPQRIAYTKNLNHGWPEAFWVDFVYGDPISEGKSGISNCRSGQCFSGSGRPLVAVQVKARDNPASGEFNLAQEYLFAIEDIAGERTLKAITQSGFDNKQRVSLPPVSFTYEGEFRGRLIPTKGNFPGKVNETLTSVSKDRAGEMTDRVVSRFIDMNGDGVKDYLYSDQTDKAGNHWNVSLGSVVEQSGGKVFALGFAVDFQLPEFARADEMHPIRKTTTRIVDCNYPDTWYCATHSLQLNWTDVLGNPIDLCTSDDVKKKYCLVRDSVSYCDNGFRKFSYIKNGEAKEHSYQDLLIYKSGEGSASDCTADVFVRNDLIDMNRDGLPDWVEFDLEKNEFHVAYNNGQNGFTSRAPIPSPIAPGVSALGTSLRTFNQANNILGIEEEVIEKDLISFVDMNGDGLPDIVDQSDFKYASKGTIRVYLNQGERFSSDPLEWSSGFDGTTGLSRSKQEHTYTGCYRYNQEHFSSKMECSRSGKFPWTNIETGLIDVNEDGLVDVTSILGGFAVYLNNGEGFVKEELSSELLWAWPGRTLFPIYPYSSANRTQLIIQTRTKNFARMFRGEDTYLDWSDEQQGYVYSRSHLFDDLDGDGTDDQTDDQGVKLREFVPFLRLKTITNGRGARTEIAYQAQADFLRSHSGARAVVRSVSQFDDVTSTEHRTEYAYSGGKLSGFELNGQPATTLRYRPFLPFQMDFGGFEATTIYDRTRGTKTVVQHELSSYYHLGLPKTIKTYKQEKEQDTPLREVTFIYRKADSTGVFGSVIDQTRYPRAFAPLPDSKTELLYDENGKASGVETLFEFDALGQLTSTVESNEVEPSAEEKNQESNLIRNSHLYDVRVPNVLFKVSSATYKAIDRHREGTYISAIKDTITGDPLIGDDPQSKMEFFHDGQDDPDGLTQGLLTRIRSYASSDKVYDTRYEVDATSGLVQRIQKPYEEATTYLYDDLTHSYPRQVTTGSHSEEAKWDVVWGKPIEETDLNKQIFQWRYDPFGRLTKEIRAGEKEGTSVEYLDSTLPNKTIVSTLVDKELGFYRKALTYHDGAGRVIVRDAFHTPDLGSRTVFLYDAFGRLVKASNPISGNWGFNPPSPAEWTTDTRWSFGFKEIQYDALDRKVKEISHGKNEKMWEDFSTNAVSTASSNPWANKIPDWAKEDPDDNTNPTDTTEKTWQYLADRVVSTDELGHRTSAFLTWDGNLRKEVRHQDQGDQVHIFSYDIKGQLVGAEGPRIDGRINWLFYERDWLGRITQATVNPDLQEPPTTVNPRPFDKGRLGKLLIKLKGWDKINPPVDVIMPGIRTYSLATSSCAGTAGDRTGGDTSSRATTLTPDKPSGLIPGPPIILFNPQNTWKFYYDEEDKRSIRVKSPEWRESKWLYDSYGRLIKRELYQKGDLEEEIVYEYDEEKKKADDGKRGYREGRLRFAANGANATEYFYDELGRVVEETTLMIKSGRTHTLRFQYYDDGGLREIEYPSGERYLYEVWNDGMPKSLTRFGDKKLIAGADSYNYSPRGQLEGYSNGQMDISFGYYTDGRIGLIKSMVKDPSQRKDRSKTIWSRNLTYWENDQIKAVEERIGKQDNWTRYRYDPLLRLKEEFGSLHQIYYDYDLNNRLKQVRKDGQAETYAYDNKLFPWAVTSVTSPAGVTMVSINHDGMVGSILEAGSARTLEFEARGLISSITEAGASEVLSYDHLDRLVRKVNSKEGSDTEFAGQWFEFESNGNTWRNHLYFAGQRIAIDENGQLHYLHSDQTGSVQVVTDERGEEESHQVTSAYGEVLSQQGQGRDILSFQGHTASIGKDLRQFGARTYSPKLRQWLSMDPLALVQPLIHVAEGVNPFRFVKSDPVNYVDPSGLQARPDDVNLWITNEPPQSEPPDNLGWRPEGDPGEPFGPIPPVYTGGSTGPSFEVPGVPEGSKLSLKTLSATVREMMTKAGTFTYRFFLDTKYRIQLASDLLHPKDTQREALEQLQYQIQDTYRDQLPGILLNEKFHGGFIYPELDTNDPSKVTRWRAEYENNMGTAYKIFDNEGNELRRGFVPDILSMVMGFIGGLKIAKDPLHHLMTNKNSKSAVRGGPWTPRFEDIATKAGITLEDAINKTKIPGHKGPHPELYHRAVYQRLLMATRGLSGEEYSIAFRAELEAVRIEASTKGSFLNKLLKK